MISPTPQAVTSAPHGVPLLALAGVGQDVSVPLHRAALLQLAVSTGAQVTFALAWMGV